MIAKKQIIEVPFELPNKIIKSHPAMIISDIIQETDGEFFYAVLISSKNINPKYTVEIKPDMLNFPMSKQSYFVTHIIGRFDVSDVISDKGYFIKNKYYNEVIIKVFYNIFGFDLEIE